MWSDLAPQRKKFRDFDYKFHIQKYDNCYGIKIGMSWDYGQTHYYIPLEKTAFADFCPLVKMEWNSAIEAQENLQKLRNWMVKLHNAQPNGKKFICE